jgi:hypothetical protein
LAGVDGEPGRENVDLLLPQGTRQVAVTDPAGRTVAAPAARSRAGLRLGIKPAGERSYLISASR